MNEIKVYKELSYIYTYDDNVYPTTLTLNELNMMLEKSKFINLWTDLVNVSSIKRVESKKVDSVENAILQINDKELRDRVRAEVKKRAKEWKITNLEILKNILNRMKTENGIN